ncbi:MAG: FAD-dependent oxidoreductase [Oscillospiraceae bacterium]
MLKKRTLLACAGCCIAAALLIGGSTFLNAGRGRAYGYQSYIELTAEHMDDDGFFLSVDRQGETKAIGDQAVNRTVERINETQSLDIEVLTGATVSSTAALQSAEQALRRAGFDTESLAKRPDQDFEQDRTDRCDVVIVGAGGAGLTAAIEAAKAGVDVIVVEKLGIAGGSTARSEGKIIASGSALQKYNGVKDTVAGFAGFLYGFASENVLQSRLIGVAERSAVNLEFLKENGVRFSDTLLSDGSNEMVDRVHLVVGENGQSGGGAIVTPLREAAEALGVKFYYCAEVDEIITSALSETRGIHAKCADGSSLTVLAEATVIACGGFDRNPVLIEEFSTGRSAPALSYSGIGSTGEVIELASDIGALIIKGSLIAELRDFSANTDNIHGLLVNPVGERFANEAKTQLELGSAVQRGGYGNAWLILDSSASTRAVRSLVEEGVVVQANSIEELSKTLKSKELVSTVTRYNENCKNRVDEDYAKDSRFMKQIDKGPFYAVPYRIASYGSLGGIRTNNRCQAMSNIAVVPGLYACGEAAFGSYMDKDFPGFGASLTIVIDSGRMAGKMAAQYAKTGENN